LTDKKSLSIFYQSNKKQVNKTLYYTRFETAESYNDIPFQAGFRGLLKFYADYQNGSEAKNQLIKTFWENSKYRRSTFIEFYVADEKVKVEIYRDDARGGEFSLRHTLFLN
jgi:hypothetical protein